MMKLSLKLFFFLLCIGAFFAVTQSAILRNAVAAMKSTPYYKYGSSNHDELSVNATGYATTTSTWTTCSSSLSTSYCGGGSAVCCTNSNTTSCYSAGAVCCSNGGACASSNPICCDSGCCASGYSCSSGSTCTKSSSKSGCFAGFETVQMKSGAVKALKDVVVGDRILSYSAKQKEFVFSPVCGRIVGSQPRWKY